MLELVSWNVNRLSVWDDLVADPQLDFALLQESPRPPAGLLAGCVPATDADWTTAHWPSELRTCIAQVSDRYRMVPRRLRDLHQSDLSALGVSRRGTLTVVDIYRDDRYVVTLASAYAAWERPPGREGFIYADASAHRLLSDLAPLLTGRRDERLIVAGDFNILHGYGEHGDPYFADRYRSVFDRARSMGLLFIGPQNPAGRQAHPWPDELPLNSRNVPTYHHSRQTPLTATRQLDFVFATENIADLVTTRALNDVEGWGPSDHCRVSITADL